jgi:proteasome lid subunit RPN8/RPN11
MVDDNMGKRKNKKKKNKSTTSQAAVNQKIINKTTAADDSWEVEIDCVEACSKAPEKVNIWFHPLAKRKVDTLMKEYTSIEWLAYLLGKKNTREIEDIFIPDQSISTARVDDVECDEYNNLSVIGVIHSHHSMGHSFSGTDHDYINGNHDISIVISHSGLAGQFRFKTPCGSYKIIEANIRLKVHLDFDDEKFIESVKPKLTKKTFVTNTYGAGYGGQYINGVWVDNSGWPPRSGHQHLPVPVPYAKETPALETSSFLSEAERLELEAEVEELDFTKDLTLAEEMELLESVDNTDEQEAKQDM